MRRRARTDANQVAIVEALRAYGCTVQHLHAVGAGCPDLLVGINGRTGLVEVKDGDKAPSARGLTDQQRDWAANWRGSPVNVVTDVDGALRCARLLAWGHAAGSRSEA